MVVAKIAVSEFCASAKLGASQGVGFVATEEGLAVSLELVLNTCSNISTVSSFLFNFKLFFPFYTILFVISCIW